MKFKLSLSSNDKSSTEEEDFSVFGDSLFQPNTVWKGHRLQRTAGTPENLYTGEIQKVLLELRVKQRVGKIVNGDIYYEKQPKWNLDESLTEFVGTFGDNGSLELIEKVTKMGNAFVPMNYKLMVHGNVIDGSVQENEEIVSGMVMLLLQKRYNVKKL
jgi:hypothetical protein